MKSIYLVNLERGRCRCLLIIDMTAGPDHTSTQINATFGKIPIPGKLVFGITCNGIDLSITQFVLWIFLKVTVGLTQITH